MWEQERDMTSSDCCSALLWLLLRKDQQYLMSFLHVWYQSCYISSTYEYFSFFIISSDPFFLHEVDWVKY